LAKGGAAYGMTNAIIGDNIGARTNPEVVAPASHLPGIFKKAFENDGGFMGSGGFVAETQVRGNDLRILLKRANAQSGRTFV